MIYILEGVDGTGKTTLSKKLCANLGLSYMHFSAPETHADIRTMYDMYLNILLTNDNILLDRSWISDYVYGTAYRKFPALSGIERDVLEHICLAKGLKVIFCTDEANVIADRIKARGDDEHILPKIEEMQKLYAHYFGEMTCKHNNNPNFQFNIYRIGDKI